LNFIVIPDAAKPRSGIHFDLAGAATSENGFRVLPAKNAGSPGMTKMKYVG
jgi:hypothetical protein